MASIQTGIELRDNFTNVMYAIINSMNEATTAADDLQATMNQSVSSSPYDEIQADIQQTSNSINEAAQSQNDFNQELQSGSSHADGLLNSVKNLVATYATLKSVESALNISDELASTTARLNLMNDNLQTTQELQNMIYIAAQDARGSFGDMAASVAKLGNLAGDAFDSSAEIVAFAEQLNKQMKLSGASTQEASSAMLQLTQSLAKGTLNGDELTSVMENGSMVVQTIADYMGVAQGEIKDLAAEGQITSDIIVAAMLSATDETNAAFESLPMTWADVWQNMKNGALIAFQPVLQRINDFANSTAVQEFANSAIQAFAVLAAIALDVFDFMASCGQFVADNWSIISPIIWGIVAALAVYGAYLAITKGIELASAAVKGALAVAEFIHCAAVAASTGATIAATAAQMGLNGAMYACPIVWIIMLVIALIAVIIMLCNWIAEVTGAANSGIGIIVGALSVAVAFIGNIFVALINMVIDIFVTLWNFIAAFVNFFGNVFTDPVGAIARLFFDLVDCILGLLQTLAGAIDALFGSDLAGAVQGWRDDLGGWVDETFGQGEEIMATVSGEEWHVDRFEYGEAWDAGVAVGDGISSAIDDFSFSDIFGSTEIPNAQDYTAQFAGMNDSLEGISGDTSNISDAMDITQEDLKYMRDIAEQDAINRFTTAEISVDMSGMQNSINSGDDIDGFMTKLTDSVSEAVDNMTEGVHE